MNGQVFKIASLRVRYSPKRKRRSNLAGRPRRSQSSRLRPGWTLASSLLDRLTNHNTVAARADGRRGIFRCFDMRLRAPARLRALGPASVAQGVTPLPEAAVRLKR